MLYLEKHSPDKPVECISAPWFSTIYFRNMSPTNVTTFLLTGRSGGCSSALKLKLIQFQT